MPSAEQDFLNRIPEWATAAISGQLVLGAQLPTRDGRRTGNAHIVGADIKAAVLSRTGVYKVLTDAGIEMSLTADEIAELFHPPRWISDVAEVMRKFGPR